MVFKGLCSLGHKVFSLANEFASKRTRLAVHTVMNLGSDNLDACSRWDIVCDTGQIPTQIKALVYPI